MTTVAALYVATDGCYFGVPGVIPYDIRKNAMLYGGPYPVVAHPPCQLWGNLAYVNYKRWGGEHNKPGNDGGTFAHALSCVVRFGGVLEHPAFTKAWTAHGLPKPIGVGWTWFDQGWVCEVWQSAYGHKARKRTWLYYRGLVPPFEPFELDWSRKPGTHQIGRENRQGVVRNNKPTLSKLEANATPIAFRDTLLALARRSTGGVSGVSILRWRAHSTRLLG